MLKFVARRTFLQQNNWQNRRSARFFSRKQLRTALHTIMNSGGGSKSGGIECKYIVLLSFSSDQPNDALQLGQDSGVCAASYDWSQNQLKKRPDNLLTNQPTQTRMYRRDRKFRGPKSGRKVCKPQSWKSFCAPCAAAQYVVGTEHCAAFWEMVVDHCN